MTRCESIVCYPPAGVEQFRGASRRCCSFGLVLSRRRSPRGGRAGACLMLKRRAHQVLDGVAQRGVDSFRATCRGAWERVSGMEGSLPAMLGGKSWRLPPDDVLQTREEAELRGRSAVQRLSAGIRRWDQLEVPVPATFSVRLASCLTAREPVSTQARHPHTNRLPSPSGPTKTQRSELSQALGDACLVGDGLYF